MDQNLNFLILEREWERKGIGDAQNGLDMEGKGWEMGGFGPLVLPLFFCQLWIGWMVDSGAMGVIWGWDGSREGEI